MSDWLERDFAALREAEPGIPGDLIGRVLDDAARLQPRPFTLWRFLGGWKGAPALACAAVAGLWLGLAGVNAPTQSFEGYDIIATLDTFAETE